MLPPSLFLRAASIELTGRIQDAQKADTWAQGIKKMLGEKGQMPGTRMLKEDWKMDEEGFLTYKDKVFVLGNQELK